MSKEEFVLVSFEGGQTTFDIHTSNDNQLFTALLGIEGYIATKLGLEAFDIREILDEMKGDVTVRPKEDMIEDAEVGDAVSTK